MIPTSVPKPYTGLQRPPGHGHGPYEAGSVARLTPARAPRPPVLAPPDFGASLRFGDLFVCQPPLEHRQIPGTIFHSEANAADVLTTARRSRRRPACEQDRGVRRDVVGLVETAVSLEGTQFVQGQ